MSWQTTLVNPYNYDFYKQQALQIFGQDTLKSNNTDTELKTEYGTLQVSKQSIRICKSGSLLWRSGYTQIHYCYIGSTLNSW